MDQNRYVTHEQESFRKWTSSPDDPNQHFTKKYGDINRKSIRQYNNTIGNESQNVYHTEFSQITNVMDAGMKRTKYNQMETLNELRQEYQILRNLPIQDEHLSEANYKKHTEISVKESVSSSSKQSRKNHRDSYSKEVHVLTLEKKQLEMVIGNSMRKIQELLNHEVEYKKIIHELQMQLESRGSDQKYEIMVKNMKRTEVELKEKIENLKKEIQRLKEINRQLSDRNGALESEVSSKELELRKCREQRSRLQDQIRNDRDRYSQLEVDYKKLKIQFELSEKDKTNQINRLIKSLDTEKSQNQSLNFKIRALEDQIKSKDSIIDNLKQDLERLRNRPEKVKIVQKKVNNNEEQFTMFQTLINHLKQQSNNQNKASFQLITSMLQNMDSKKQPPPPPPQNNDLGLLAELQSIKDQLSRLKRKDAGGSRVEYSGNSEYLSKIASLENDLADYQIENMKLKEDYSNLKNSYDQMSEDLEVIHKQCLDLRNQLGASQNNTYFNSENMKADFRKRQVGFEEQIRNLRKQLDEALFIADREKKDKDHTINLLRTENASAIKLLEDKIVKLEADKQQLKSQLEKMKAFYEAKLQEKNQMLQKMSREMNTLVETNQKTLISIKGANEGEMKQLMRKLHQMADINDRYIALSARCSDYERQVHQLRHLIRKFKVLNDNVDHLWMVKEAEYGNLHMILDSVKIS